MKFAEKYIVKLLLSRSGPILQKAITGIAAAAITYGSQKIGLDLSALGVTQEVMIGILWAIIDIAVTKLPANIMKDYGEQIQKLINAYSPGKQIKVDGFIGPQTVAAAAGELDRR